MRIHPRNHVPRKLWYGSQYLGGHLWGISWGRKWYGDRRKELHRCIWWIDHQNIWRYISPIVICKRESYIHGHKTLARDGPMNSCEKLRCFARGVECRTNSTFAMWHHQKHFVCIYIYLHTLTAGFLSFSPNFHIAELVPPVLSFWGTRAVELVKTAPTEEKDATTVHELLIQVEVVKRDGSEFQKAGALGSSRLGYSRWTQNSRKKPVKLIQLGPIAVPKVRIFQVLYLLLADDIDTVGRGMDRLCTKGWGWWCKARNTGSCWIEIAWDFRNVMPSCRLLI